MEIKDYLRYDPDTGKLYWIKKLNLMSRIQVGDEAGCLNKSNNYLQVRFNGKGYYAHRLAWYLYHGKWPENQIDHINRIKIDNRIQNLRDIRPRENNQNKKEYNIGATYGKDRNKWRSQIYHAGKHLNLGDFSSELEAQQIYLKYIEENISD